MSFYWDHQELVKELMLKRSGTRSTLNGFLLEIYFAQKRRRELPLVKKLEKSWLLVSSYLMK